MLNNTTNRSGSSSIGKPVGRDAAKGKAEPEKIVEPESPDAHVIIDVATDRMYARMTLIPAKEGGKALTEKDILDALGNAGVVAGIKEQEIKRIAQNQLFNMPFRIAYGKEPEFGKDEELKCFFNTDISLAPKVLEDGTTDYRNMGMGTDSVKQGDLIAEILPATSGMDGYDVLGNAISGKDGKEISATNGSNVNMSEDGRQIFAACDGNVILKDGKIHVNKEMKVDGVNQTTGNIFFSGDIVIAHDVRDGFTVRAGGNVTVGGVVENATIIANNDIIIKTGVNGENSSVTAGGTLTVGYVENGKASAGSCIYADAVLNSTINCGKSIVIRGKRGCVIGGKITAGESIEAKVIGNSSYIETRVSVIRPDSISEERNKILAQMKDTKDRIGVLDNEIKEINKKTSTSFTQKKQQLEVISVKRAAITAELNQLKVELDSYPVVVVPDGEGYVKVNEHIYPNVFIHIDGAEASNSETRPVCKIVKKKEKIHFGTV